jgi:hypothetical protein
MQIRMNNLPADFRRNVGLSSAKIEGKIFHGFRRTAIHNIVRAGVPERVQMAIRVNRTGAIFDRP